VSNNRKIEMDLNLGWVKKNNENGVNVWNCYDPKNNQLLGTYKENQVYKAQSLSLIERHKEEAETYKGVILSKKQYKKGRKLCWESRLHHEKKSYYVGLFETPKEAAIAYNKKIKEMKLEKKLNEIR